MRFIGDQKWNAQIELNLIIVRLATRGLDFLTDRVERSKYRSYQLKTKYGWIETIG